MKLKDAIARIEELEKRVRDLEARPVFVPCPYPAPMPIYPPAGPIPWNVPVLPYAQPAWQTPPYILTCQTGGTG